MGQQLFKVNFQRVDTDETKLEATDLALKSEQENIHFFFPVDTDATTTRSTDFDADTILVEKIRRHLLQLTKSAALDEVNADINHILTDEVLPATKQCRKKAIEEITTSVERQHRLRASLTNKYQQDDEESETNANWFTEEEIDQQPSTDTEQINSFVARSLTSTLLLLIKSVEKIDSTLVSQMITLTGQLCEELPAAYVSTSTKRTSLIQALQPMGDFFRHLSAGHHSATVKILLRFAVAQLSFKEILPLLARLVLDTEGTYVIRRLLMQLNNELNKATTCKDEAVDFLKSIGVYPNTQLMQMNCKAFTGQLISAVLLTHIDVHQQLDASEQLDRTSIQSSFSFEFHPKTFEVLFDIITRLTTASETHSDPVCVHMLTICIRLFTQHLNYLSAMQLTLDRRLLSNNGEMRKLLLPSSDDNFDLSRFAKEEQLTNLYQFFLNLSQLSAQKTISEEASKAFVCLLRLRTSSFTEKLTFLHRSIVENQHPKLIAQLMIELSRSENLLCWLEALCDKSAKQSIALQTLEFLMQICLNPPKEMEQERIEQLDKLLSHFQQLLFTQLAPSTGEDQFIDRSAHAASSVVCQYLTCLFQYKSSATEHSLFNSALVGLCLLTEVKENFEFATVQPIFATVLPLLADYIPQSFTNYDLVSWLTAKITSLLISGSPFDSLEIKHVEKFQGVLFAGGYESNAAEQALDLDFLMSIYNNVDNGHRLLTTMKMSLNQQQCFVQSSTDEQANELVAAVYAVYIKHFDRIALAKFESRHTEQKVISNELLSIFKRANHARTMLRSITNRDGDRDQFCRQTKSKALFLLQFVRTSHSIPVLVDDTPSPASSSPQSKGNPLQRQISRRAKVNRALKLMRRKQVQEQRPVAEDLLSKAINDFLYQEEDLSIDELKACLDRQVQRATTRLRTYQVIEKFILDICQWSDDQRVSTMLINLLSMSRGSTFEWSYLENIPTVNLQLREKIAKSYYSILRTVLPVLLRLETQTALQSIFNYLNLNYTTTDLIFLANEQIPGKLFPSEDNLSLRSKLLSYQWLRLFTLKLCQNIELEQRKGKHHPTLEQQREYLVHSLIEHELQPVGTIDLDNQADSFNHLPLGWFRRGFVSTAEKDLWINQYLTLLLRCCHSYAHFRTVCATVTSIKRLLDLSDQSASKVTRLLALKLLRQLIPYLPSDANNRSEDLIEKFFRATLRSIGQSFSSAHLSTEILDELVYLYRTVLNHESVWKPIATNFLLEAIKSTESETLIASLCILGGYIFDVGLSSIVRVITNGESRLAMVLERYSISSMCSIQYIDENEVESMAIDRLRVVTQVPPPNLSLLSTVDSILDALGHFLQMNASQSNSPVALQIQRRSISALSHLLQDRSIVETLLSKPYAPLIAQLSLSKPIIVPTDLRSNNKHYLERYSLHLDHSMQTLTNDQQSLMKFESKDFCSPVVVAALSESYGWRAFGSESEIAIWREGRMGNDELKLIHYPITAVKLAVFEQCGEKHRFNGRISLPPKDDDCLQNFPTFIVENLEVSKGKWYFAVKISSNRNLQIGWATERFTAGGQEQKGVGDDEYSWSYDGSQGASFNNGATLHRFNDIRWREGDVCGCGIDIDGERTNIKYWLNGHFLGTAFQHQENIPHSYKICNLLPHGRATRFFPAISLLQRKLHDHSCDLIFSPEDMEQCPLPNGYKPLLLPTSVHTSDSLVAYPCHAYMLGDHAEDYLYTSRTMPSTSLLRDFVSEDHLATKFRIDDRRVMLPEDSDGFPLVMDPHRSAFTVAFDYDLLQDEQLETLLTTDYFSIAIPLKKASRVVIVGNVPEQQMKVYWDNESQTFPVQFPNDKSHPLTLYCLPKIAAGIRNIAVWNYALSDDHIERLFVYGLFYISADYQRLQAHRKRMNTFSFEKKLFADELLIPFDQPFNEQIWQVKKKQAEHDEEKYFSTDQPSAIELFGNETFLVLDKSAEPWWEYTLILEISIANWPTKHQRCSLVQLNDQAQVYISHKGKLCLQVKKVQNESKLLFNLKEYYRLCISVKNNLCQIFINGELQIELKSKEMEFTAYCNRFELFREEDPTKNTTAENKPRIRCRSITFLDQQLQTPNSSLQQLVAPPFSIIAPSLIAIGYTPKEIKNVIEQHHTTEIHTIDRLLREEKDQLENYDNERFADNESIGEKATTTTTDALRTENQNYDNTVEYDTYSSHTDCHRSNEDQNGNTTIIYRLHNLYDEAAIDENPPSAIESREEYLRSRLACEKKLVNIYARDTLLRMFEVWSSNSNELFPLDKLGHSTFLVQLFQSISSHQKSSEWITSWLKAEMKHADHGEVRREVLEEKASLLCALHNEIVRQGMEVLFEASSSNEEMTDHLKNMLTLLLELLSTMKGSEIEFVFPIPLINLLFKLFRSMKSDRSKIFILHIFSCLMQTSESFKLPAHIEEFFVSLLAKLPADKPFLKELRLSVIELIFLWRERGVDIQLTKDVQNLFDTIGIIKALTDQKKTLIVPEGLPSSEHFHRTADLQLFDLMNKSPQLEKSLTEFIDHLPTEVTAYQNHPILSNIPTECILARAKFFGQLHDQLVDALPIIDCSLPPGENFLADQIRQGKMFLFSFKKSQLLDQSLQATGLPDDFSTVQVDFDLLQADDSSQKNENSIFHQAYRQLSAKAHDLFRKQTDHAWEARYVQMHSADHGGPYRDSITRICSDLCSSRVSLFILCPNGRTGCGLNRDCWIPNVFEPSKPIAERVKKEYQFVGQLMGLAIRQKHYLNVKFAPLLWKGLLFEPITIDDIQAIDLHSFTPIGEMEREVEQAKLGNTGARLDDISNSIFYGLHFEMISSTERTFELVPGESKIPITAENFNEYSSRYRQYRLNEFNRQIECLRQGLHSVIPSYYLNLLTASELEEAVCGKSQINVELLKRNTVYRDAYEQASPVIERFWKVFDDKFNPEQKKMFLVFTWGRSTLPMCDADFTMKFGIHRLDVDDDKVDQALPQSQTCFFTLRLPGYSTEEIMYERLNYAITQCASIDTDGVYNDATRDVDDDDDDYDDGDYEM